MPRPIWKGQISFGLVNVPVTLYPAERRNDLGFQLIDSANSARVRYQRVNDETGEEVPWDRIVKGYEYDGGNYVLLDKEELESAAPELTKTIEIEEFVDLASLSPLSFDKPYYLVPGKGAAKGYVLLREALRDAGRVGIAQVVLRARGHLAALLPLDDALVLELLRYPQELRALEDFDLPEGGAAEHGITKKELQLATQLIDGMTEEWDPERYHDSYRERLMELIEERIASGDVERVEAEEEREEPAAPRTLDFMEALEKSLAGKGGSKRASGTGRKRGAKRAS